MSSPPIATPSSNAAHPTARRVSGPELVLVLGLPTALFLAGSLGSLARHAGARTFTDARIAATVAVEVAITALLLPMLRRRGWRPGEIAGAPEPRDLLSGAGVWLASTSVYYIVWIIFELSAPESAAALRAHPLSAHVSALMIVVVSFVNPLFEEFLWLGYGITALGSRLGLRGACIVSLALRMVVHAYQGPLALVGVLPVTTVFTLYYARTRRLWPIVVAHVIVDALGLVTMTARG